MATTSPDGSLLTQTIDRPLWRTMGWLVVFLLPLFGRVWLIGETPALYSWDAFTRLWDTDAFIVRHWLPLPQTPVFVLANLGFEVMDIRLVYAVVGAGAATVFGLAISRIAGTAAGLATALLASSLPIFVKFSIVPYQEGFALLFLATALLALHDWEAQGAWLSALVAAAALACGVLCRYELWGFCGLLCLGFLARRRWRGCLVLVPAVIAGLVWMATAGLRETPSPITSEITRYEIGEFLVRGLESSWGAVRQLAADVLWPNLLLAVLGAVVAFRRGGRLGREFLFFWLALIGMVVARDINVNGITDRMTLLPSLISVAYVAIGVDYLAKLLLRHSQSLVLLVLAAAVAAQFSFDGYRASVGKSRYSLPELEASQLMLGIVAANIDGQHVIVIPRRIPNKYGEDPIKSIFAHSTRLDPRDDRWIWGRKRIAEEGHKADLVVRWDRKSQGYVLLSADE